MNRKHVLVALVLVMSLLAGAVHAQSARKLREQRQALEQMEMTMLVKGHVDIDREGRITAHALDRKEELPDFVVTLVEQAVARMRFEPIMVDGTPVLARARMTLRLVAEPTGDDMAVVIRSAHFGDEGALSQNLRLRLLEIPRLRFPRDVVLKGGSGTVYLLLKVGRDGTVQEVVAEQTNLTVVRDAEQMARIRRSLENAAVRSAPYWRFAPLSVGEFAERPYWVARVPVRFHIGNTPTQRYGQWEAYHPGPRAALPAWANADAPGFSPDLLPAGIAHSTETRFRLLDASAK